MANKPRKQNLVNGEALCAFIGISPPTLRNWERAGLPIVHKGSRGKASQYDSVAVLQWRDRHVLGHGAPADDGDDEDGAPNLMREAARLKKEQADGQALKNAVMRRELVPAAAVVALWAKHIGAAKSKLRSVKSKLPSRIPKLTAKDTATIQELINQACNELSGDGLPDVGNSLAAISRGVGDSPHADAE
jgi:phage terminase Nu1 subunit (DNA packaging protein)